MSFRALGISPAPFQPLFDLDDVALAARGMCRMIVDEKPGSPCRVSLEDAEPGESVLLLPFEHQPANSPYRASGPIFVRQTARETFDAVDVVPPVLRPRLLSIRGYDERDRIVQADVAEGAEVEAAIANFFARDDIAYLHIHFAKRGCFACKVERA